MAANEYILGLMAIVSGLALTEWIGSLYRLLAARKAVRWDWLASVAAVFVAFLILRSWWISWRAFAPDANLTLGRMTWNLAELVFVFLSARASLPESVPDDGVDLRAHYASHSWLIWGGVTLSGLMLIVSNLVHDWRVLGRMWSLLLAAAIGAMLTVFPQRWLHRVAVPLVALFYVMVSAGERMSGD